MFSVKGYLRSDNNVAMGSDVVEEVGVPSIGDLETMAEEEDGVCALCDG